MRRKYIKSLAAITIVFMVIMCMGSAACGGGNGEEKKWTPDPKAPEMIDTETLIRLQDSYVNSEGEKGNVFLAEYCGTYNGCVAVLMKSYENYPYSPVTENVAGVDFAYEDANRLKIWRDDLYYTLLEAYDKSLLTVDDLKNIAYYHANPWRPDPLTPLCEDKAEEIRRAFLRREIADKPYLTVNDIQIVQYCGTYDGRAVVMIHLYGTRYDDVINSNCIAGVEFLFYDTNNALYVCKNDYIYDYREAFSVGILSLNDVKNIAYYHATEEIKYKPRDEGGNPL